ncbi:hypothetical protein I601_2411 [Nocardioides dokdonensis FR1436]|uniref:Endonuclease/exonuclease/phosphatase domain-containing protein n=1 Tax=Nocardioides dokdonensis FR1436 TaxID=1300347 RepID=A0A1A9GKK1_9ACTN|nr:endonuclease/exonuclease/phosphatase family protein [Nocardioides dokdonensis]ANH38829.1 hypothetical protein I601_2411 [Nocardioides dokdonensis FR1436]
MSARRVLWWVLLAVTLVPALLLSVLRVAELEQGQAVRLVSFAPYALPGYAAALLLLLAVVRRRRAARVGVLLALAGLVVHAWWLAPLVTGPTTEADGEPLTVMSSNLLRGRGDAAAVVAAAVADDVDVLVLQEVTAAVLADLDRAGLDELMPHRIGHPDAGEPPFADTVGTMVFARTPLEQPVRLGTELQSWRVEVEGLTLLALHSNAPTDPAGWISDHAVLREAARDPEVDLLVGDFNATLDHAPLQRLVSDGYRDAVEQSNAGWQPTWPDNGLFKGLPLPPLVAIDHVLTQPGLAATGVWTVPIEGTDHRAILVELRRR